MNAIGDATNALSAPAP